MKSKVHCCSSLATVGDGSESRACISVRHDSVHCQRRWLVSDMAAGWLSSVVVEDAGGGYK
jgi:hypothetical protein